MLSGLRRQQAAWQSGAIGTRHPVGDPFNTGLYTVEVLSRAKRIRKSMRRTSPLKWVLQYVACPPTLRLVRSGQNEHTPSEPSAETESRQYIH